jgi:hypothetical protein
LVCSTLRLDPSPAKSFGKAALIDIRDLRERG